MPTLPADPYRRRWAVQWPDGRLHGPVEAGTIGEALEILLPAWCAGHEGVSVVSLNENAPKVRDLLCHPGALRSWTLVDLGPVLSPAQQALALAHELEDLADELDDETDEAWARLALNELAHDALVAAETLQHLELGAIE